MTCSQVRDYMRRSGADVGNLENLPPEVAAHLRSCTGCLSQRRVVWLMRMGSGPENGVPSPGFEERLRRRLMQPEPAAEPMSTTFAGLARPALAAASLVAALSLAVFLSVQSGVLTGGGTDLSLLAASDRPADAMLEDWGNSE
jgi:hypothetical protein